MSKSKRLLLNSVSNIIAKVLNAAIQLICLPVVFKVFGKDQYGLIVIAMSLNAFRAIFELGLPVGISKYVAEWLAKKELDRLINAMRTICSIYFIIATLFMVALLIMSHFFVGVFKVAPSQVTTLKLLIVITGFASFVSIPVTFLDQLLIGAQEQTFLAVTQTIKSVLYAILVLILYLWPSLMDITRFYSIFCLLMIVTLPFKALRWSRYCPLRMFFPGFCFESVRPIIKYCLGLMSMGIFIILFHRLCPIILSIRLSSDVGVRMSDYQAVYNIIAFVLMISGVFTSVLIPHIASEFALNKNNVIENAVFNHTKYIWVVTAMIGFGIITLSPEIIELYLGKDNLYLSKALIFFMAASLYNLYNPSISSLIMGSGKIKQLIFCVMFSTPIGLIICWVLSPSMNLISIAIATLVVNIMGFLFTHFYYLPKNFNVSTKRQIMKVLLPPVIAGLLMVLTGRMALRLYSFDNSFFRMFIAGSVGSLFYMFFIVLFYIKKDQIISLVIGLRRVDL